MMRNKQIKRLINEVRCHPCLWDKGHKYYSNAFHVDNAWTRIARQIGLSENTAKLKWKKLRSDFNKISRTNTNAGNWPYFDDMLFLSAPNRSIEQNSTEDTELLEVEDQDFVLLNVNSDDSSDVLPESDEYYDLLFLESLAQYFKRLEPVRKVAMRVKIQDMLMKDIAAQIDENMKSEQEIKNGPDN